MAIRLKPDDGDLHFNRGVALQSAGQMAAAEAEFKEAGRLGQKNAIAFLQSPSAAKPEK
jgi:Flp pilus assembly protein TadD